MTLLPRFLAVLLCLLPLAGFAELVPSTMFGDGMVLQREQPVPVWGTATAGEKITVSFAGQSKSTKADDDGAWRVTLDPLKASANGRRFTIAADTTTAPTDSPVAKTITFTDVLVGEVWICSGQSNMQMGYQGIPELKKLLPDAEKLPIRHFAVTTLVAFEPQKNVRGAWSTKPTSSAVAFGFSYYLQQQLDVPVAVIQTCWGSSRIEGWMPLDMTDQLPHFKTKMAAFEKDDRQRVTDLLKQAQDHPKGAPAAWISKDNIYLRTRPNILYNAMLHPVAPYATRGMAWYQGEANGQEAELYAKSLPAWVKRLRSEWQQDDFHFLAVMLPGFGRVFAGENKAMNYPDNHSWSWFREAQLGVLDLPYTGVANTIDLGDAKNIHPKDKEPIGKRLALLAARDVNKKKIIAEGPIFKSMKVAENTVTIHFDSPSGLKTTDGKAPTEFWIAGKDRQWQPAKTVLNGNIVELKAEGLAAPVAIRYAFAGLPKVNLVNADGLPTRPFRTDSWPQP